MAAGFCDPTPSRRLPGTIPYLPGPPPLDKIEPDRITGPPEHAPPPELYALSLPRSSTPPKKHPRSASVRYIIAGLVSLLVLSALLAMYGLHTWSHTPYGQPTQHRFTIQPGSPARAIALQLHREGLIRHPMLLLAWLKWTGRLHQLQAGDYTVVSPLTPRQLTERLRRGTFQQWLTIPEGWTKRRIARRLVNEGWIKSASQWIELVDRPLPADLLGQSLTGGAEGFCFPETYRFDKSAEPETILHRMVRTFAHHWEQARPDQRSPRSEDLTMHQVVTLASIVQREARNPSEMPRIASVFLNRWRRGMRLQSCATVRFALGEVWNRPLRYDDLEVGSPYNTYKISGLPPGPIANPGRAAIEAVLRPASTDDLYFVYAGDGHHLFSRTHAGHRRAIGRARAHNSRADVTAQHPPD